MAENAPRTEKEWVIWAEAELRSRAATIEALDKKCNQLVIACDKERIKANNLQEIIRAKEELEKLRHSINIIEPGSRVLVGHPSGRVWRGIITEVKLTKSSVRYKVA